MTDKEKFEGLKRKLVEENEAAYGEEIRARYGDDVIDESNAKMLGMTRAQHDTLQQTAQDILARLESAVAEGISPDSDTGRDIALLHKQWLSLSWPRYTKEAHLGLVQMYLDDSRFTAYYDTNRPGCAQFLRDAVHTWASQL